MEQIQQRLQKFKQKQKGFTLVELIVVIAIIGILAAILLPKYFGFTDDARKSAAVSEAKSIRSISETYYSQNNVWPGLTITGGVAAKAGASGFANGNGATILTASVGTINSPTFPGVISNFLATSNYPTAAATGLPADGSFNYTSNTGHTVKCDANGTVTDID